jgi:hypothetical protein
VRTPSALVADRIHRRYVDKTLVLATEFETPGGRLTLTDALAVGPNERGVSSAPRLELWHDDVRAVDEAAA